MRSSAEFPTVIVYFVTLKRNGFTEYPSCHDYIQRHCPNVWLRKTAEKHRWVLRVLSDLLYYKTPAELIPNLILDSLIQISGSHIRYWIKFCWCHSSVVMDNSRGERLHSEFHSSAKYLDFQATTVMIRVTLLYRRGSIIYIYIYIWRLNQSIRHNFSVTLSFTLMRSSDLMIRSSGLMIAVDCPCIYVLGLGLTNNQGPQWGFESRAFSLIKSDGSLVESFASRGKVHLF